MSLSRWAIHNDQKQCPICLTWIDPLASCSCEEKCICGHAKFWHNKKCVADIGVNGDTVQCKCSSFEKV